MSENNHVKAFLKLEQYLCHRLGCSDPRQLDNKIMDWAAKDKKLWAQWEDLVRNGKRLEELRLFSKSLDAPGAVVESSSGGIFDL